MRFLLHSRTAAVATATARRSRPAAPSKKFVKRHESYHQVPKNNEATNHGFQRPNIDAPTATATAANDQIQSWGQQCSPDCGCVVRFETKVDPVTKEIVETSYQAKTLVTKLSNIHKRQQYQEHQQEEHQQQHLEPQLTNRTNRPMFSPCSCETLHKLSKEVVEYLPGNKLDNVRSLMEFPSSRSSLAFQRTVLSEHGRPTTDSHCFDVFEEALTAAVQGRMPQPRRVSGDFAFQLKHRLQLVPLSNSSDGINVNFSMSPSPASAASSTLSMLDSSDDLSSYDFIPDYDQNGMTSSTAQPRVTDWLSYVDEYSQTA